MIVQRPPKAHVRWRVVERADELVGDHDSTLFASRGYLAIRTGPPQTY